MKRNTLIFGGGVLAVIALLVLVISSVWIGFTVEETCARAEERYRTENCVTALTTQVTDEDQSFAARNDAVWALGQLGDEAALPVLQSLYTGEIPAREPWNETMSQYELRKAIHLLQGGWNVTVPLRMFRFGR